VFRPFVRALAAAAFLGSTLSASGASAESHHTILYYVSSAPITESIARPLVAYVAPDGHAKDFMYDGMIVFSIALTNGGPKPGEVAKYRDALFSGGQLAALASAVRWARSELNRPDHRLKVYLAAPYESGADANANVQELLDLWSAWNPPELELVGFYWGHDEAANATIAGEITATAAYVHARNLELIWIPYFSATGTTGWPSYGLDRATLQPNYAFNDTAVSRFLQTDDKIRAIHASGPELELAEVSNPQVPGPDTTLSNAMAYLGSADTFNWSEADQITYYHGTPIAGYATSATRRSLYDRIWRFVGSHPDHPTVTERRRLIASADGFAEMASSQRAIVHGSDGFLNLGTNAYPNALRAFVRFDFDPTSHPGEAPAAAYLRLSQKGFPYGTRLDDVQVGVVEQDWSESTLCGAVVPPSGTTFATHRFMPEAHYAFEHTIDVTDQVGAAIRLGRADISFSLARANEDGTEAEAQLYARESGAATAPALELVYLPAAAAPDAGDASVDATAEVGLSADTGAFVDASSETTNATSDASGCACTIPRPRTRAAGGLLGGALAALVALRRRRARSPRG
jgi:hypothetical protein